MDRSYDKSVEKEFLRVSNEYMRVLNTGIYVDCPPPSNREGIEALRRCIRERKTYPELVGYVYPEGDFSW